MSYSKQMADENRAVYTAASKMFDGMSHAAAVKLAKTGQPLARLCELFPGVRPNGVGHPRWPQRYSVIRYNGDDAEHLLETDDYDVAVATCGAAADAYLCKITEMGLSGYQKVHGRTNTD